MSLTLGFGNTEKERQRDWFRQPSLNGKNQMRLLRVIDGEFFGREFECSGVSVNNQIDEAVELLLRKHEANFAHQPKPCLTTGLLAN